MSDDYIDISFDSQDRVVKLRRLAEKTRSNARTNTITCRACKFNWEKNNEGCKWHSKGKGVFPDRLRSNNAYKK